MIKRFVKIGRIKIVPVTFFVTFSLLTGIGLAAEATSVGHEVTGKIVAMTRNFDFISVEYKYNKKEQTSYQVALPLTGRLSLINLPSLKALKVGDTVNVEYSDITDFDASNQEIHKRLVTAIRFIRAADAKGTSGTQAPATLDSGVRLSD
jgi:hypothetical protein